jgi:peptidoglycan/LPS O-acetylase OafA/YrhL
MYIDFYRKDIDGLRAIAVVAVILFHAGFNQFKGGFVGVDVFFVISGYLITSIILREIKEDKFTLRSFYERRLRRLLPALFLLLTVCIPIAYTCLIPYYMVEFAKSLVAVPLYVSNILFYSEIDYFNARAELKPLLHTWSLAVEEQFYIIFPLLLVLLWKFARNRIEALLLLTTLLSFILAKIGSKSAPDATFFFLHTRWWELLIGVLVAFRLQKINRLPGNEKISQILSALGLLSIILSIAFFDQSTPFPGFYALLPTFGTLLVIVYSSPRTIVGNLLSNNYIVKIGVLSYSAYLWHQPVFSFARHINLNKTDNSLKIILICLIFIISYLSWRFIEQPIRHKTILKDSGTFFKFCAIYSMFLVSIGLFTIYRDGFKDRWPQADQYLVNLNLGDQTNYVVSRFNQLKNSSFNDKDERPRILIIGDSYAQDLVNALYETKISEKIQISTRHISGMCGNLFIPKDSFIDSISYRDLARCESTEIFEDPILRARMMESDEIWFASNWQKWQANLISKSVENVIALTGKKVRVFGRKQFGSVNIRPMISIPLKNRISTWVAIRKSTVDINNILRTYLPDSIFIDTQSLLCQGKTDSCLQFLSNGRLISYDGSHLTKDGALYYGLKLIEAGLLEDIRKDNSIRRPEHIQE